MKAVEVEVMDGYLKTWIMFLDQTDVDCLFGGRQYTFQMLTDASRERLARVLSTLPCEVRIDGVTPYFVFKRPLS